MTRLTIQCFCGFRIDGMKGQSICGSVMQRLRVGYVRSELTSEVQDSRAPSWAAGAPPPIRSFVVEGDIAEIGDKIQSGPQLFLSLSIRATNRGRSPAHCNIDDVKGHQRNHQVRICSTITNLG